MKQLMQNRRRTKIIKALRRTTAAVLSVAVLCQPNLASAAPHGGGGGFHGGGGCPMAADFTAVAFTAEAFITDGTGGLAGAHTGNGGPDHWY